VFERFTESARKVMSLSRQEAQRLQHGYIGSEHLLLGILQEGGGVPAKVLKHLDIDAGRVRDEIGRLLGPPDSNALSLHMLPFSPLAKRTIELAGEAAAQLGHEAIGTEHLLLGLIQEKEGIAGKVLASLNLNFETAREMVLKVLAQGPPPGPAAPPPPGVVEENLFDRARGYLALTDRPEVQESIANLLQQGRSVAIVGPNSVGKTSLVFALSRAKPGNYWSIDYRMFDEFHRATLKLPKRPGTVCFIPEGELVTASRSLVADFLDERRRAGERLLYEFRDGGFEAFAARHPDLAKELVRVDVAPPSPEECRRLLEGARPRVKERTGVEVPEGVLAEADVLARTRWPRLVAPWPTLIALWKAAVIQNENGGRGDVQRLEKDIEELEKSSNPQDRSDAAALRHHVEGLRGMGAELRIGSVRQAIGELADRPQL